MVKRKSEYARKAEQSSRDYYRTSITVGDSHRDFNSRYDEDPHARTGRKSKQKDKNKGNEKRDIIKNDKKDNVVETRKRVGKKQKPYMGKRVTHPGETIRGNRKGRTVDCETLIDAFFDLVYQYGYDFNSCNNWLGYDAISAMYEFYGKHCKQFYALNKWIVVMAHIS